MSFYIFTSADGMHFRHTEKPYSITVIDDRAQPRSATFDSPLDDFDCGVSFESNRLAMGFWRAVDLTVFDLQSGAVQATFPFREIGPIAAFDQSGNRLLFKSGSRVILLDVRTGEPIQVKGVQALDRLITLPGKKEILVASNRKGQLLRISLKTGDVRPLELPIDATFFDLKPSPTQPQVILIDKKKGIHCLDQTNWGLVWSVSLKKILTSNDHVGVGQFCGDGTLFGCAVSGRSSSSTLVLNAQTGEEVRRIKSIEYGLPYRGTLVRSQETRNNSLDIRTLDLQSGTKGVVSFDRLME